MFEEDGKGKQADMTRFVGSGWKRLWREGITPWDLQGPTPILQWFLRENKLDLKSGPVLVPGCGSGWDLGLLKKTFAASRVVGMDISEEAVTTCKQNNANCTVLSGDFFAHKPDEPYSLVYDHTFFCALKPAMRSQWGQQMSRLISEDGYLLAVVYPQTDADLIDGPPYLVKLDDYLNVLPDFKLIFHSTLPSQLANHSRRNAENELIALFQKLKE